MPIQVFIFLCLLEIFNVFAQVNISCEDNSYCIRCNSTTGICLECKDYLVAPHCHSCVMPYYGKKCEKTCGICKNSDLCNIVTGHCTQCENHYIMPHCTECKNYFWSSNCNKPCGKCKHNAPCCKRTGFCTECLTNFEMPFCNACKALTFGVSCNQTCHCADGSQCDRRTGKCQSECHSRYTGNSCQDTCPTGYYGHPHCKNKCECIADDLCSVTNGFCVKHTCVSHRYGGPGCQEKCPPDLFLVNSLCVGVCQCNNNSLCDVSTGRCLRGGCRPGYWGVFCEKLCIGGTFGDYCRKDCHCLDNKDCHHITGQCPFECAVGFTDYNCQTPTDITNYTYITLIGIGVISAGLLVGVGGWVAVAFRKRRRSRNFMVGGKTASDERQSKTSVASHKASVMEAMIDRGVVFNDCATKTNTEANIDVSLESDHSWRDPFATSDMTTATDFTDTTANTDFTDTTANTTNTNHSDTTNTSSTSTGTTNRPTKTGKKRRKTRTTIKPTRKSLISFKRKPETKLFIRDPSYSTQSEPTKESDGISLESDQCASKSSNQSSHRDSDASSGARSNSVTKSSAKTGSKTPTKSNPKSLPKSKLQLPSKSSLKPSSNLNLQTGSQATIQHPSKTNLKSTPKKNSKNAKSSSKSKRKFPWIGTSKSPSKSILKTPSSTKL